MMAQRFPEASVTGVEVDPIACAQAGENVKASPFATRVKVREGKIQDCTFPERFDCVVCNPPFFEGSLRNPDERRAIARHADLLPFDEMFFAVRQMLSYEGRFSIVIPHGALRVIMGEAFFFDFFLLRRCDLRSKANKPVTRHLLEFGRKRDEEIRLKVVVDAEQTEEVVYDDDNVRSEWYTRLTEDFYLSEAELRALKASQKDARL